MLYEIPYLAYKISHIPLRRGMYIYHITGVVYTIQVTVLHWRGSSINKRLTFYCYAHVKWICVDNILVRLNWSNWMCMCACGLFCLLVFFFYGLMYLSPQPWMRSPIYISPSPTFCNHFILNLTSILSI